MDIKLKFISDPGHGWLEVPMKIFKDCLNDGISFSKYSYVSVKRRMAYLEEDCDAVKIDNWFKLKGIKPIITHVFERETNIRNMERFF